MSETVPTFASRNSRWAMEYVFRGQGHSPDPTRRIVLESGQRKAVQSDRVGITLGPIAEQRLAERIFRLYAYHHLSMRELVHMLNEEGHRMPIGNKFTVTILRRRPDSAAAEDRQQSD